MSNVILKVTTMKGNILWITFLWKISVIIHPNLWLTNKFWLLPFSSKKCKLENNLKRLQHVLKICKFYEQSFCPLKPNEKKCNSVEYWRSNSSNTASRERSRVSDCAERDFSVSRLVV